ncbi:MAG: hypothetical protein WC565_07675 [Parcubacteria group bacterium]|jgi:hypothetical protein
MAFTYEISGNAGKVRLLVSDTADTGHVWEDDEVAAALTLASENVFDAAAILLESARASFKKLISVRLFGEVSINSIDQSNALGALAASYREIARCDAGMQMTQLQLKIDKYGRDYTDHELTTAKTEADFEDYSGDEYTNL